MLKEEKLLKYRRLAAEFQQMYMTGQYTYHSCGARMYRCGVIQMPGLSQENPSVSFKTVWKPSKSGDYWNYLHLANN